MLVQFALTAEDKHGWCEAAIFHPSLERQEILMAESSQQGEPKGSERAAAVIPTSFPGPIAKSSKEN